MAGMDLTARRSNRGISVFWMILAMGVGVFALLAILLIGTDNAVVEVERGDGAEITVNEGDTQVNGIGNTEAGANDNDATFLGDTQTIDGPQPEGDTPNEDLNAEVVPGDPVAGEIVDPDARGTDADLDGAGDAEPVAPGDEVEAPGDGEVVVDPDGTTAPVVPTPSGPEGRDDETIAE